MTDPPSGICGELVPAEVVELIDGFHQTDVAFLDQVQELESAIGVTLSDRNHQPEIRLDQLLFGRLGFQFPALDNLQSTSQLGGARAGFFFELLNALA